MCAGYDPMTWADEYSSAFEMDLEHGDITLDELKQAFRDKAITVDEYRYGMKRLKEMKQC